MRALVIAVLVAVGLGAFGAGSLAVAQPAHPAAPAAPGAAPVKTQLFRPKAQRVQHAPPREVRDPSEITRMTPHGDRYEADPSSRQPGMALLFWAFAAATLGGALFVITRRNLIAAVMGMVGSFLGISAIYMMLYANFLAVLQMLVYAGAIMVLFVFVIMVLNRPEDEPVPPSGRAGIAIGGISILYLVGRLVMMLIHVQAPAGAATAPPPITLRAGPGDLKPEVVEWGSVKAVGTNLFDEGLFPFEAISILLLIAVVGAIAIARPLRDDNAAIEEGPA